MVIRDVVFDETKSWNWNPKVSEESQVGTFEILICGSETYIISDGDDNQELEEIRFDDKDKEETLSHEQGTRNKNPRV